MNGIVARRNDHFCVGLSAIIPGDERDCDVCSGAVTDGKQLEERKKKLRKRIDRPQYKRELWIPSNA
jgi:hypothetical protein